MQTFLCDQYVVIVDKSLPDYGKLGIITNILKKHHYSVRICGDGEERPFYVTEMRLASRQEIDERNHRPVIT